MSTTLLQLKTAFAANMLSAATLDSDADTRVQNFINQGLQHWALQRDWSVLRARTTLDVTTAALATLPTNYRGVAAANDLLDVREVNSGTGDDVVYKQVHFESKDDYATDVPVYWVFGNDADGWYLYTNQTDSPTLQVMYLKKPTDLSAYNDVVIVPDPYALIYYAGALYKSSTEFEVTPEWTAYISRIAEMWKREKIGSPPIQFKSRRDNQGMTNDYDF